MKGKRKAEEDGDQDDRFVNQGASSSSAPVAVAPAASAAVRVDKRKADSYPEGEEHRCEEVIIEECQVDRWVCEITERELKEKTKRSKKREVTRALRLLLKLAGTMLMEES